MNRYYLLGVDAERAPLVDCVERGRRFMSGEGIGTDTDAITKTLTSIARMKHVTVAMAGSLLQGGQDAIGKARAAGINKDGRQKTRDEIYWKLKWHENNLVAQRDKPQAQYDAQEDLKTWVGRAFQEYDVMTYAKEQLAQNWGQLWADMWDNFIALPENARHAAGKALEWITGVPNWVWPVAGIVVVGGLAYAGYKVAAAAAPIAARAVAERYLP